MATEPSPANFRKLLLIEDEYMVARAIVRAVGQLGVDIVGPAASVASAVELAQTADFDCALLDINLQGLEAYPVADILVRRGKPFAFLTGYDKSDILKDYRHIPMLQKPLRFEALKAMWGWGA
jgi:CheY-like chemotaxis protein